MLCWKNCPVMRYSMLYISHQCAFQMHYVYLTKKGAQGSGKNWADHRKGGLVKGPCKIVYEFLESFQVFKSWMWSQTSYQRFWKLNKEIEQCKGRPATGCAHVILIQIKCTLKKWTDGKWQIMRRLVRICSWMQTVDYSSKQKQHSSQDLGKIQNLIK